ncbi:hypothetical protein GCM10023078_16730 [Gibbsiella greigii]
MAATRSLLAGARWPDALFCANDIMAIGALNVAVGELGMIAGEDISVVGFDDIAMAGWPIYNLTTYVQPISEMVSATVVIISSQLKDVEASAIQQVLPGMLVVRGSTRPIAGDELKHQ